MNWRPIVLVSLALLASPCLGEESIEAVSGLVVDLGSTPVGAAVTTVIAVSNPSGEREMPFGFSADEPGFEVGSVPKLLAPGERIEIPITLLAEAEGEYELVVRIYRDLGEEPEEDGMIAFQVIGEVTPP